MTLPIWSPFAFLAASCLVLSPPTWVRRVDWLVVAAWTLLPLVCWAPIVALVWWLS